MTGALVLMATTAAPVSAQAPAQAAIGTGEGYQGFRCPNFYFLEGTTVDGETWMFTLEYISLFYASPNVITVPCPWSPVSMFQGTWDPDQGGRIQAVEGLNGHLSLTDPQSTADGILYAIQICYIGLCSQSGGEIELRFVDADA